MGFAPPRRVQIEFSHAVQTLADTSGAEVTADAICALFTREYLQTIGPAARAGASASWHDREVALAHAEDAPSAARQAAAAFASAAGVAIDITSCEVERTVNGETAVFVGARIGDAALRHGAGVHRDPVAAATDAVASAINRSAWSRDKRRAAA